MQAIGRGANALTRWVTLAIISAVTLLSGCLILALIVGDTFQYEVHHAGEDMPTDNFMLDFRHEDVASLEESIRRIPEVVTGVDKLAQTAGTIIHQPHTITTNDGVTRILREGIAYKGVEPDFFHIRQFPLAQGRYFDAADEPHVAVIGAAFAVRNDYVLGSMINHPAIKERYRVIGILQPNEGNIEHPLQSSSKLSPDSKIRIILNETMFTPYDSMPQLNPADASTRDIRELEAQLATNLQLWVGVEPTANVTTVMEEVRAYLEGLPGVYVIQSSPTPPAKAMLQYVAEQTTGSLEQMGFIVIVVGALSISGLMLMHVLLGAKVIGIKRALGATRGRLVWENLWRYSILSLCGFILSLILIQPLIPLVGSFLGSELQVLPKTLLFAMLGVTALAPLCGLIPTLEASRVSPLDAIRDRLGWGLGKRRLDLRQIIVSLAFAAAVGTMFLVSQIGFSTLAGIDANLRAVGRDMLLVEEPPPGSVSPIPTLTEADDASLCVT